MITSSPQFSSMQNLPPATSMQNLPPMPNCMTPNLQRATNENPRVGSPQFHPKVIQRQAQNCLHPYGFLNYVFDLQLVRPPACILKKGVEQSPSPIPTWHQQAAYNPALYAPPHRVNYLQPVCPPACILTTGGEQPPPLSSIKTGTQEVTKKPIASTALKVSGQALPTIASERAPVDPNKSCSGETPFAGAKKTIASSSTTV